MVNAAENSYHNNYAAFVKVHFFYTQFKIFSFPAVKLKPNDKNSIKPCEKPPLATDFSCMNAVGCSFSVAFYNCQSPNGIECW